MTYFTEGTTPATPAPYFHDGSAAALEEVVDFHVRGA